MARCLTLLIASVVAVSFVPAAGASAADDGTASYGYHVPAIKYAGDGAVTGAHETGTCSPGEDAAWTGHLLANVDRPEATQGEAALRIGHHGTKGHIDGVAEIRSVFENTEHTLTTACEDGRATDFSVTQCTNAANTTVGVSGRITGRVGTRLTINWSFQQLIPRNAGAWLPNTLRCVQPFAFPNAPCETKSRLNVFTQPKFTLPFDCFATTATPPPGLLAEIYVANTFVNGSITLKRFKQS